MIQEVKPGLIGQADEIVTVARTASYYGSGLVAAYGTPAMIALMENAAVAALQKYLGPGRRVSAPRSTSSIWRPLPWACALTPAPRW